MKQISKSKVITETRDELLTKLEAAVEALGDVRDDIDLLIGKYTDIFDIAAEAKEYLQCAIEKISEVV